MLSFGREKETPSPPANPNQDWQEGWLFGSRRPSRFLLLRRLPWLSGEKNELVGFDPFGGLEDEVRNNGADTDAGGVRRCFNDKALVSIVARILPLGHDLDSVADLERFGAVAGDGLVHRLLPIGLVFPIEDGDIACGNAEAVDVVQSEAAGFAAVPIFEALLATGENRGLKVRGFNGVDMRGALAICLTAIDGEGVGGWFAHERRYAVSFCWKRLCASASVSPMNSEDWNETSSG